MSQIESLTQISQGNGAAFAPTYFLLRHKWEQLRNGIMGGDFISLEMPQQVRDKNIFKLAPQHLLNYLKIFS
jgi:hypothetical protein